MASTASWIHSLACGPIADTPIELPTGDIDNPGPYDLPPAPDQSDPVMLQILGVLAVVAPIDDPIAPRDSAGVGAAIVAQCEWLRCRSQLGRVADIVPCQSRAKQCLARHARYERAFASNEIPFDDRDGATSLGERAKPLAGGASPKDDNVKSLHRDLLFGFMRLHQSVELASILREDSPTELFWQRRERLGG